MHFCIDRFEYPDVAGEYPVIMVNWNEAGAHCADQGKRLCTEDEWTFACEGEMARPYANGFARDRTACVIDHPWRPVDFEVFVARTGPRIVRELDDLWQGEPTGSRLRCRSPFGAYDMTGNVDEWTVTTHPEGLRSILKGGYWGPVHARCRTSTRVHNEDFYFYQIGFRCCAPPPPPPSESTVTATPASAPSVVVTNIGMHIGGGPNDAHTKEPIARSVAPHFDALRACWATVDDPHRGGDLGVDLLIPAAGGFAAVSHPRTGIHPDAFRDCVVKVLEQVEFVAPRGGRTTVSYSLRFDP
jgi:hypothetical protein